MATMTIPARKVVICDRCGISSEPRQDAFTQPGNKVTVFRADDNMTLGTKREADLCDRCADQLLGELAGYRLREV